MPITQHRMIALIAAARAYETALDTARREAIQRLRIAHRAGNVTAADDWQQFLDMTHPNIIVPGIVDHKATLAVEERHFATHQRYNDRRAEREWRKRRAEGRPSVGHTPPLLVPGLASTTTSRTAPKALSARTVQRESILDEVEAASALDPSMADDPDLNSRFAPSGPGLTDERKAEIEAELDELEGRGEPGEVVE